MPDPSQAPALSLAFEVTHAPLLAVAFFSWRTVVCWLAENYMPHVFQDQTGLHARLVCRELEGPNPLPDLLVLIDWKSPNRISGDGELGAAGAGDGVGDGVFREELSPC